MMKREKQNKNNFRKNHKSLYIGIFVISSLVILLFSIRGINFKNRVTYNPTQSVTKKVSPHFTMKNEIESSSDVLGVITTPVLATKNNKKWGVIDGWKVSNINNFILKTGVKPNYVVEFIHWGNENKFNNELSAYAKKNKMTLVIFWEAMNYNFTPEQNSIYSYDAILKGKYDAYIKKFAADAKAFNSEVIIIPFEEMNGDWYSWSGTLYGNSPDKHNQAYAYLRNKFRSASKVKFGWAVNSNSVPEDDNNAIEKYYPGDSNVDIVGVDGFNFGDPWMTYSEIFDDALSRIEKYKKPVMIFSMSTRDGVAKSLWIDDAIRKISLRQSIVGWIWFNENKEHNWSVWSDSASLLTFKQVMKP